MPGAGQALLHAFQQALQQGGPENQSRAADSVEEGTDLDMGVIGSLSVLHPSTTGLQGRKSLQEKACRHVRLTNLLPVSEQDLVNAGPCAQNEVLRASRFAQLLRGWLKWQSNKKQIETPIVSNPQVPCRVAEKTLTQHLILIRVFLSTSASLKHHLSSKPMRRLASLVLLAFCLAPAWVNVGGRGQASRSQECRSIEDLYWMADRSATWSHKTVRSCGQPGEVFLLCAVLGSCHGV